MERSELEQLKQEVISLKNELQKFVDELNN